MDHPKRLLVEGKTDAYAVASLLSHHVKWGQSKEEWPVFLDGVGSVSEILHANIISTHIKESGIKALGVMIDADDEFVSRWNRIKTICKNIYPSFPEDMPVNGLVHVEEGKPRFGVWIMPDNKSRGMLETLLAFLVPSQDLWNLSTHTVEEARKSGAPFKDVHSDKAKVHTWLAWQDPPGQPLGEALKAKCLDPSSAYAKPFVDWFRRLFEI